MFLSGTLLNVAAVVAGTTVGLVAGGRMPARMHSSLIAGLGFFTAAIGISLAIRVFAPDVPTGDDVAVLAALLLGVVAGELLRIEEGLEWLGRWFRLRFSRGDAASERPSRVAEAFVTASLVFCVGPLTILGSLDNGLRGDMTLLSVKALLDGVASVAFAAALGPGVYLSALTVLVVQGTIAGGAFLLADAMDATTILAITATGGLILIGIALRLLDLKAVPVANFLPALVLAPIFIRLADWIRAALG